MANLTTEEALSLLRDGMYGGQDAVTLDYVDVLEIYNTFKELVWEHKRTVAELTMCRGDRVRDYEDRLKSVTAYHGVLRQYACTCPEPCPGETLNAEYCGWNANKMIGG
jgi:hypothetical protein